MYGESTIDILRGAPGVRLVALFSPEHGLRGEHPAGVNYGDHVDAKTGLTVTRSIRDKQQSSDQESAQGIDAMVIDLQDIGSRATPFQAQ